MSQEFSKRAHKKPGNVGINRDLLEKAENLNINQSALLGEVLIVQASVEQQNQWKSTNAKYIHAYNRFVEEHGVFSDGLRKF